MHNIGACNLLDDPITFKKKGSSTPDEQIVDYIVNKGYITTDFLVYLVTRTTFMTEILSLGVVIGNRRYNEWQHDWYEGEDEVTLLGYTPVDSIFDHELLSRHYQQSK